MPRGFQGESVAQEARGGSRAAVERGRAAASRSFQTSPMEDSSRFQQASRERDERGSYNPGNIAREALTFDQFMTATGRSETNPYGDQGFFSRVFGIDPSKINYAANTPGGIATLNKVNALAYDQYLNPRDARGNIRGMLREGSPTQYGTVAYDPSQATDFGIAGALPLVGPMLQRATRRSGLTIFDDYMGDLGNELGAFPEGFVAAPRVDTSAAEPSVPESTFRPLFTTDPEERNLIEEDFEVNPRATDEDSPFSRPVPESTYRPIFTDDAALPSVADVIAAEPMVTSPPAVSENRVVQTREGRIPDYNPNPAPSAPVARESILGPATDRLRQNIDELEDTRRRMEFFQDVYDELYPAPESVSAVSPPPQPLVEGPVDLVSMLPPPPVMTPTPKPSRGPNPGELAFARILEQRLAQQKAMR